MRKPLILISALLVFVTPLVHSKSIIDTQAPAKRFQSRLIGRWVSVRYEPKDGGPIEYPGEDVAVRLVFTRTATGRGTITYIDYEDGVSKRRYTIEHSNGTHARLRMESLVKKKNDKPSREWLTFTAEGTLMMDDHESPFMSHFKRVKTQPVKRK